MWYLLRTEQECIQPNVLLSASCVFLLALQFLQGFFKRYFAQKKQSNASLGNVN